MLDLTALTAEVTVLESVEAGAVTVINTLMAEVAAAANDPAAIQAIVDRVTAATNPLAAAIAANTPAPAPTAPAA